MSCSTAWEIDESEARAYDRWYETRRGREWLRTEEAILKKLLAELPGAETALEVGCGTGRFCTWLKVQGYEPLGLDRSLSMLLEASTKGLKGSLLAGDAHRLPFWEESVDVAVFVTTLEFLKEPMQALKEAARVARHGLILLVLNRWSLLAFRDLLRSLVGDSRRAQARRLSPLEVRRLLAQALGGETVELKWVSSAPLSLLKLWGGVTGWLVKLAPTGR